MVQRHIWTKVHATLQQNLRQKRLLGKQQRLLIALSGGQDSLCLTKLLLDLQPKWQWDLGIAHCDHRWLSDLGLAQHVQQIAQTYQLPFYLKVAPSAASKNQETEAAARKWRYQALQEIAQEHNFEVVITAHTKSDRAETLLYNLIRGSGADGMSALNWQRYLTSDIELVRPLLNISRQETGEFCQQFQLPIWEDVVNQNLYYARNRLRLEIMPQLKKHFNPQVEAALAQTAELLRADVAYLETCAQKLLEQVLMSNSRGLNRLLLRQHHLAMQRRVMRKFWQQAIPQAPTFEQIESLTNLINAPNRSRTSSLPGKLVAQVSGDYILLELLSS